MILLVVRISVLYGKIIYKISRSCYEYKLRSAMEKLEEKNITRTELRESVKLASSTYSKLIKNESVTTDTLLKISLYLQCDVSELIESLFEEVKK